MKLFGRTFTRRELERYTGRLDQIAGIRLGQLMDGREQGVRTADVRNGGGLTFTVLLDRGMDIGAADYQGTPLAFLTAGAFGHPAYFSEHGTEWLRNWGGGLVTGCGLRNVGGPSHDNNGDLPMHGRLSNLPAQNIRTAREWTGDDCILVVEGEIPQTQMFGENLHLTRRVTTVVGSSQLTITDHVRNAGFRPEPVFILYHTNWGYPLISESAHLECSSETTAPRDDIAADGQEEWMNLQPPTRSYEEKVYYHEVSPQADGQAMARIVNPELNLAATIRWRTAELPYLTQWKMMGEGEYVLGIEPANCHVEGHAEEMKGTPHCVLAPGESREFTISIGLSIAT
ncbi:MAG: aldose 1-epimerase family protein [Candidatus Pacebacteria bacterium]|nr:aldose 1-epimerase family protein [Candidatus Paceibacterota bacterium]